MVFKDANAVVSAQLKGQLMSSSASGISSNSQRKICRTDNGIYHVVYESMNSVIYTHSLTSNFDGEWAADQIIGVNSKNPAIDYHENIVKVVFEYYYPLDTTDTELWIYTFTQQANGKYEYGGDAEIFATCPGSYFGSAKPVIAYNNGQVFIAYRKNKLVLSYPRFMGMVK